MAGALALLGTEHALLVSSEDGLDELSISAPTRVVEVRDGEISELHGDPRGVRARARRRPRRSPAAIRPRTPTSRGGSSPASPAPARDLARAQRRRRDLRRRRRAGRWPRACGRPRRRSTPAPRPRRSSGSSLRTQRAGAVGRRERADPDRRAHPGRGRAPARGHAAGRARSGRRRAPARRSAAAFARGAGAPGLSRDRRAQAPLALGGRDPRRTSSWRTSSAPTSAGGAAALSVLTEERELRRLARGPRRRARRRDLPILRKDFIVDAYQVHRGAGRRRRRDPADRRRARRRHARAALHARRGALGLGRWSRSTTSASSRPRPSSGAPIIGINNRDLTTLEVDIERTFELRPRSRRRARGRRVGDSRRAPTSSGSTRAGVDAVLVGEALMRAADIEAACRAAGVRSALSRVRTMCVTVHRRSSSVASRARPDAERGGAAGRLGAGHDPVAAARRAIARLDVAAEIGATSGGGPRSWACSSTRRSTR